MRISDWSSDVCSSDLRYHVGIIRAAPAIARAHRPIGPLLGAGEPNVGLGLRGGRIECLESGKRVDDGEQPVGIDRPVWRCADDLRIGVARPEIGRASCRERVWQYV